MIEAGDFPGLNCFMWNMSKLPKKLLKNPSRLIAQRVIGMSVKQMQEKMCEIEWDMDETLGISDTEFVTFVNRRATIPYRLLNSALAAGARKVDRNGSNEG
jgi:hypothetical protein